MRPADFWKDFFTLKIVLCTLLLANKMGVFCQTTVGPPPKGEFQCTKLNPVGFCRGSKVENGYPMILALPSKRKKNAFGCAGVIILFPVPITTRVCCGSTFSAAPNQTIYQLPSTFQDNCADQPN